MNTQSNFLPFHAINEFMRPEFRLSVIRDTLNALPELDENLAKQINNLTRKLVKVTGFRNSEKAPLLMKVMPMAKAFEKSPELVAATLSAWAAANDELSSQAYELMRARGWYCLNSDQPLNFETLSSEILIKWPLLPRNVDRTKMPGFYILWPKGEDYDTLYKQFTQMYPDSPASIDKVSLMIVWLSLRLPYQMEEMNNEGSTSEVQS